MSQETFTYSYSAKINNEIREIRNKYLLPEESKLDELKRLDATVQNSGIAESLCFGAVGALVFGIGLCLAMKVIGSGTFFMALGVLLGIIGTVGMLSAYPVYCRVFEKTKEKHKSRILELTAELMNNSL